MNLADPVRAAQEAAFEGYSRLVAILAARSGDVAAAEDALSDALESALRIWPQRGIPDNPAAWLVTAARRVIGHDFRHRQVRQAARATLDMIAAEAEAQDTSMIPDERLKLLFVCAHPAIDTAIQAPLMLQTVLGLDAARIAARFLVPPATMAQRLVRAKTKIRDAGIAFRIPDEDEWPQRLDAVLAAVYAAFGTGWEDEATGGGLSQEAICLARVLRTLLPRAPETMGLLALMLYSEARRAARRDKAGRFVPLQEQETARWDHAMIAEAEDLLRQAGTFAQPGRFQIEAAIQSVHAQRARTGRTDWRALVMLYDLLSQIAPTTGGEIALCAVIAEAGDARKALERLDRLVDEGESYQPWWATRARILSLLGQSQAAAEHFRKAAALTPDQAVSAFLEERAGTA